MLMSYSRYFIIIIIIIIIIIVIIIINTLFEIGKNLNNSVKILQSNLYIESPQAGFPNHKN